jgi:UDP-glucose 4-epimerase
VGDSKKAREVLGWKPQFPELEKIIESAWNWHQAHPDGYADKGIRSTSKSG